MPEGPRHLRYWAKTVPSPHPVLYHCLDVAAVGRALLEGRPRDRDRLAAVSGLPADFLGSFLPLLLSFHDLGKLADGFQCQRPDLMTHFQGEYRHAPYGGANRHDSLGYAVLDARRKGPLSWLVPAALSDIFSKTWLSAAMGHHGVPPINDSDKVVLTLPQQFPPGVARDLDATLAELRQLLLPAGLEVPGEFDEEQIEDAWRRATWLFAGLAVEADWLGSNPGYFPPCQTPYSAQEYFDQVAWPAAERAVREAGLTERPLTAGKGFAELWPGFAPTPLQELAANLPLGEGPQLFVIEEVTGGGKTEAALTLAHRLMAAKLGDGLYFGLPTMATANAMYGRLSPFAKELFAEGAEPSLVLAHGRRELHFDQLAESSRMYGQGDSNALAHCAAWLSDSRKKALLAEVGVGTIDQALIGVLMARHQSLRLWGLAGKVLIVDEVHAADSYMQELLCLLLLAHAAFGSSAILLSATLPVAQRSRLIKAFARGAGFSKTPKVTSEVYPAVAHFADGQTSVYPLAARPEASRTIQVRLLHEEAAVDAALLQTLAVGGCACWIRNTVRDAMAAYDRFCALLGPENVDLFHAGFTVADRHHIEQGVLRRFGKHGGPAERRGRLLIATQVVEQSLDLDFDTLISDLAPIDLLIQRAGRLRRHARNPAGERLEEGTDQRGDVLFQVFSPPDSPEVGANWVSSILPGTARVYDNHGQLYLGARWLAQKGQIRVPEDLRAMIEAVYGPEAASAVPEPLAKISDRAEGESQADRATARHNQIQFELGYEPTDEFSSWRDDVSTPTRLGDPTVTLRLGRIVGGEVQPLCPGARGWQLSEVNVRQATVFAECSADAALIEKAKAGMPDFGKWILLLILREVDGQLEARAQDSRGREVRISYSSRRGLEAHKD